MVNASNVQDRFDGGEWSKAAQGRVADPRYRTALAVCRNYIPVSEKSLVRRPGTHEAGITRGGQPARLLPYDRGVGNRRFLELSDGHGRFWQNELLTTDSSQVVTNITTADPAVFTVADTSAWASGQEVRVTFQDEPSKVAYGPLLNRTFLLDILSGTTFVLRDPLTTLVFSGLGLTWNSALLITVERVLDIATPYTNDKWRNVRTLQDDEHFIFLEGRTQPQEILDDATLDPVLFVDGPYLDPFPGSEITPDNLNGVVNLILSFQAYDSGKAYSKGDYVSSSGVGYKSLQDINQNHTPASSPTWWEIALPADVVNSGSGFTAADAGRHIRLYSEPPLWASSTTYSTGNVVSFNGSYWSALKAMTGATPSAGDVNPNQPGLASDTWAPNPAAARWTWGKITETSVTTSIPGIIDLTGFSTIGNMLTNINNAFDGNLFQQAGAANGAAFGGYNGGFRYAGKNFTGSSKKVSFARVYPATFNSASKPEGFYQQNDGTKRSGQLYLYAKQTAPSGPQDGTFLGSVTVNAGQTSAANISSSDPVTTWAYVWVVFAVNNDVAANISEVQFFDPDAAASGAGVAVQIIGDPLLYTSTIRTWRLGLYNDVEPLWPKTGTFHEGRLWLGSEVKSRLDGSVSNAPFVFSPTAPDGTIADSNAISYTVKSKKKQTIHWLKSDRQGVLVGASEGEFLVHASNNNDIISPTSIQTHPISDFGCSGTDVVDTGLTTVFVHRYARQLQELFRDAYSGQFVAPEITDDAKHFTRSGVAEITRTSAIDPILWARTNDGTLFATTYQRSNLVAEQPLAINAFHGHTLGSGRSVVSLATGPAYNDALDTLGLVTFDGGVYHVEFLGEFGEEDDTIYVADYLDAAVVPATATTDVTGVTLTGLRAHEGSTVTVFMAGLDMGEFLVSSGAVLVPYTALMTKRGLQQLAALALDYGRHAVPLDGGLPIPALVGYTHASQAQVLRPIAPDATGAQNGPGFAKVRRNHQFGMLVDRTRDMSIGTDFAKLMPIRFPRPDGLSIGHTDLFSGVLTDLVGDDSSLDGMIAWQADGPYPSNILAVGGFIRTEDK